MDSWQAGRVLLCSTAALACHSDAEAVGACAVASQGLSIWAAASSVDARRINRTCPTCRRTAWVAGQCGSSRALTAAAAFPTSPGRRCFCSCVRAIAVLQQLPLLAVPAVWSAQHSVLFNRPADWSRLSTAQHAGCAGHFHGVGCIQNVGCFDDELDTASPREAATQEWYVPVVGVSRRCLSSLALDWR